MSEALTLDQLILQVEKPVRYMGGEWNQVVKAHTSVDITMALCFPDIYEIGMSHMGVRILYSLLNKRRDVAFERCFTPWVDMIEKMRASGVPLTTLESRTPVRRFDVVGFSLQYEMSFTNILLMLDLAGIPLRSAERDLSFPLVVAGGPVAMSPEPMADFVDAFVIGDGEETLALLLDRMKAQKREGDGLNSRADKRALLRDLGRIPGVYVPALYDVVEHPLHGFQVVVPREKGTTVGRPPGYEHGFFEAALARARACNGQAPLFPVVRQYVDNISDYPFPSDLIVPYGEIVHDRISVEIARGCLDGCRFCQAGYTYRPLRERSIDDIVNTIVKASESTGFDEATIASLSTADYSCLNPLLQKLMDELEHRRIALSLTSMRADSITPEVTSQMKRVRKTGLTIAPEAGTQRMRDIINKNITEESVLKSAATAFEAGWDLIKLYFMIGLPMETEQDVRGIFELGKKVKDLSRQSRRAVNVNLSASSFIPKPHTPFQWFGFCDLEEIKEKQRLLRSLCRPVRINFKHHHPETSQMECVLSRGDRRVGRVIERAYRSGCRFDGWDDHFQYARWLQAFEQEDVDYRRYLKPLPVFDHETWRQSSEAERRDGTAYIKALSSIKIKPLECSVEWTPLPWDHLDNRVDKKFIVWDLKRSLQARVSPTCGPELCYNCGLECEFEGTGPGVVQSVELKKTGLPAPSFARGPGEAKDSPPVERAEAASVRRYRAAFSKLGQARFLSHLDLMRLVQRAFRRAGIQLKYTQGFHPQPVVSFGPALSVGIEGLEELLDFEAAVVLEEQGFLSAVNSVLPDGVRFTRLKLIDSHAPAPSAIVRAARYIVELTANGTHRAGDTGEAIQGAVDRENIARRLEAFRAAESFMIQRQKKDRTVSIDLRSFVRKIELLDPSDPSPRPTLELEIEMGERGSVKPQEVLKSILNISDENFHAIRRYALFAERNGTYYAAFSC